MKKTFRDGLFETNSSSVHTLVFKNNEWAKPDLDMDGDAVIGRIKYFGKDGRTYDSQNDKLSYLLTCMWCFCGENLDRLHDSSYFDELEEIVTEHTGASKIKLVYGEGEHGMDHQTYPEYYGDCPLFDLNRYNMENFIFNDNVALKTAWD